MVFFYCCRKEIPHNLVYCFAKETGMRYKDKGGSPERTDSIRVSFHPSMLLDWSPKVQLCRIPSKMSTLTLVFQGPYSNLTSRGRRKDILRAMEKQCNSQFQPRCCTKEINNFEQVMKIFNTIGMEKQCHQQIEGRKKIYGVGVPNA